MEKFLAESAVAVCFSGALAILLCGMLRFRAPMWAYLMPLVLPVLFVLADSDCRNVSIHGFMHSSFVYEIFERGVPPENPLLAGERLNYPYGYHVVIAALMRFLPASPPIFFAGTNVVCIVLLAFVIDRIARLISLDRSFRVLAVLLALLGPSPFSRGPLWEIFCRLGAPYESRYIPFVKFLTVNTNQVGILLFAVGLLGLVNIVAGKGRRKTPYGYLAVGLLGAGLLYPVAWSAIVACAFFTAIYLYAQRKSELHTLALVVFGILVLCSAAVMPYLLSLNAGKAGGVTVKFLPSFRHLTRNGEMLLLVLAMPLVLAWAKRAILVKTFSEKRSIIELLVTCTLVLQGIFLCVFFVDHAEYKFLALSLVPLSFLVAIAVGEIYRRRMLVAMSIVFLVGLSFGGYIARKVTLGWPVSDRVVSKGRFLYHDDSAERELYNWISRETSRDAVFVDSYLTIPPLARRRLFIGLDLRRERGDLGERSDGWRWRAERILEEVTGADSELLERRHRIAERLLSPPPVALGDDTLKALAKEVGKRSTYVVARDEGVGSKLLGVKHLVPVYQGNAATVFRFIPDASDRAKIGDSPQKEWIPKPSRSAATCSVDGYTTVPGRVEPGQTVS